MKANSKHQISGIYCIINTVNNKKYVGKSKNIYMRIIQHISNLNKKSKDENRYLINSWHKYGRNKFDYFILEYLPLDEKLLSERELFWIELLNVLDKNFGYNLRKDSSTGLIIHKSTSKKISERLKKEWKEGIRKNHSKKLSDNWKENPDRKKEQSKRMSKNLTKYIYKLYTLENIFIKDCTYKDLMQLHLNNVIAKFCKKKISKVKFKGYLIERLIIEDIVRHSKKLEIN